MNTNKKILFISILSTIVLIIIFSLIYFIPGFTQRNDDTAEKKTTIKHDTIISGKLPKSDTVLSVENHNVFLKICSQKKKGTFLLLHGWNLPAEDWCNKTSLCSKLITHGYCIVMPDMGKSVYQGKNYPETYSEWKTFPTREWLSDTLIPLLQNKYSLLIKNDNNYIVGLSTGARGVALMLLDFPELFKGAAALSGDYDQTKMTDDYLMTGYYGRFAEFKERWEKTDNPISRIKEFKTPIYLGHGRLDQVVPPEQTIMFYDSLKKYHPGLKVKLSMPDAQHDYYYWGSEVDNFLKFFGIE